MESTQPSKASPPPPLLAPSKQRLPRRPFKPRRCAALMLCASLSSQLAGELSGERAGALGAAKGTQGQWANQAAEVFRVGRCFSSQHSHARARVGKQVVEVGPGGATVFGDTARGGGDRERAERAAAFAVEGPVRQ